MALQSDHEFAPTEIARAVFPTAFRGYDQDAVRRYLTRLATALEHNQSFENLGELEARTPTHDRVEELEAEIASLQDEIRELETELVQRSVDEADHGTRRGAEAPEFDEHRAIELLGQETARVLESARSAAADILKRAESQAAALKSEAKKELADARRRAKQLVAEKRAEADEAIDQLTEEAERSARRITDEAEEHRSAVLEESSKILAESESEAQSTEAGAQERARQIMADAEALRQQVIAELVADRRTAQADLDRLVEARDRLALSLTVARSELDEMVDSLAEATSGPSRSGARAGEGKPVEVDGDEVARLIDHLEAKRADEATAEGDEAVEDVVTGHDDGVPADSGTDADDQADTRTDVDGEASSRRSIVDEPTVEMPVVFSDDDDDDDDEGDETVEATDASDDPESTDQPGAGSAGVFDDDEPAYPSEFPGLEMDDGAPLDEIDLRDPEPGTDGEDDDLDIDLDTVLDTADVLNDRPAEGAPLSLVEGFSTIVLADEEPTSGPAGEAADAPEVVAIGVLVDETVDPELVVTTVSGRAPGAASGRTQGDLALDDGPPDRLPAPFSARDVALTRSGANLRRQLRRALNDDQSEVLDRLRSGRGAIRPDELMSRGEQIEHYLVPLRRGLADIARAGARAGGAIEVRPASLDNLIDQLAVYLVDRVRTPTVEAIEAADHTDRERILDPIRSLYRDFRNLGLPDLVEDALHEAFAIGLYDAIEAEAPVRWEVDPRTDPDPVCEVNRERADLVRGEAFPSGHVRPLGVPGCRCLVVADHDRDA